MTLMEKFNLTWLAHAMTDSPDSNCHYYYDSKSKSFFQVKTPLQYDGGIELYDAAGLELSQDDYYDIFMRLTNLPATDDEIIEIGRLGAAQKRDIQWQFLTRFCAHKYHFKYFMAVIDQPEHESFVLDRVISGNDNERLLSLWEKFKLEVIRIYANNFARTLGIEFNLMM
jgi:hypothetical protein